ncbi:MAG: hypothetical protein GXP09_04670 [Gammaproteobacteria bacterium]|nr:hypothetical protein [Gammaproteobacteria bacterium]
MRRHSLGRSLIAVLTLSWLSLVFQACAFGASIVSSAQLDEARHVSAYTVFDDAGGSLPTMDVSMCQPGMCHALGVVSDIVAPKLVSTSWLDPSEGVIAVALIGSVAGQWSSPISQFWFSQPDYLPPQPTLKFRVLLI